MIVDIKKGERIIFNGSGTHSTGLYQVKEINGWETKVSKCYNGDYKGNLIEDMKLVYKAYLRHKEYRESKLKGYH